MTLRFAELFAGAGGLSMGLERAGWSCAWHAEIADAPRAILTHRWPDVPLYGDVLALNGRELTATHGAIDLLTGGSPCQDLSVAGRRAGLGGDRSSLFFEQMRLWDETGADLCLWENVDGARSSNDGRDFGAVLRAFVGAAISVPSDGWRSAGVAAGPAGVAAWRVLDAQFFGVPQRRRRVFVLGTRTGRIDPAEVLSLAEGVRGDSQAGREAGEVVAAIPASGAGTSRTGNERTETSFVVVAFGAQNSAAQGASASAKCAPTLDKSKTPAVLAFNAKQDASDADTIAPSLLAVPHDESRANGGGQLAVYVGPEVAHSLRAQPNPSHRADSDTYVVSNTITAREAKGWNPARAVGNGPVSHGIPRRLTPRECERLMSWPDDHTLVPDGKGKLLSDAARYKAIGNGVASVHSQWIGWRLRLALGVE